jgi:hypothetical protein
MTIWHKIFILYLSKYGVMTSKHLQCKIPILLVFSAAASNSQQDTRTVQGLFQALPKPQSPLSG